MTDGKLVKTTLKLREFNAVLDSKSKAAITLKSQLAESIQELKTDTQVLAEEIKGLTQRLTCVIKRQIVSTVAEAKAAIDAEQKTEAEQVEAEEGVLR